MRIVYAFLAATLLLAAPARAALVQIEWKGEVDFNQTRSGQFFFGQGPGSPVLISMTVDSNVFTNSSTFPTRGYAISSFSMQVGAVTTGLQSPFPAGQTPYFVIRNNDPAVDGFYLSTDVDGPTDLPLAPPGRFSQFMSHATVTYVGTRLPSLDILSALGVYDYTGLTVFGFSIVDGPFDAIGINFTQLTISTVAVPVQVTTWSSLKGLYR